MAQRDDKLSGSSDLRSVAPYLTMGIQLAIPVIVFFFIGRWLDGRWNTSPWLMIGGIVLGGVGAMIKFVTSAMRLSERQDADDAEHRREKKA